MNKFLTIFLVSVLFSNSGWTYEKSGKEIRKPANSPEALNKGVAQNLMAAADLLASAHPDNVCETDAYPVTILEYLQLARNRDNSIVPTENIAKLLGDSLGYRVVIKDPTGIHSLLRSLPKGNPDFLNGVVFHGPGMGVWGKMRELQLLANGVAVFKTLEVDDEAISSKWVEAKGKWYFNPRNEEKDYRDNSTILLISS